MQFAEAALKADGEARAMLLKLAEREQSDGMKLAIRADATARRGQILGIISILMVLVLAGYVAQLGQAGWACAITAVDVVSVAGVFVTGQVIVRGRRPR
ncbi:hypothetical protein [Streptomyces spectabilis]|uniref:DUF2335 domain-containing protein n=1 Tax=Streptomyces spectabilis TaxID=68270 RepID=A0A516R1V4_STRST|nr:hypothetical protein [Streptomyces spectabilis]QDQ09600.1 hypothetical protein FH965_02695 [Streptomyces spectabilis]